MPEVHVKEELLRCNEAILSVSQIWDFDYERFPQADTQFKPLMQGRAEGLLFSLVAHRLRKFL
jgi:hypothetical protein